ncbi:MAG: murein L,D-transpeptidase catalytic domain family protein [Bdellovibrio sp.]
MKAKIFAILFIAIALLAVQSQAAPSTAIYNKILSQGVPADALNRMVKFLDESKGRSFQQDTYTCAKFEPDSVKPCEESERSNSSRSVTLETPETVAIVDFSAPSTTRRFFLINLKSGEVIKHLVAHGKGSGNSNYATKFSNIKDSRQTSLGFYLGGDTYAGKYGRTLRLYGLQRSNDKAYHRDIVLHGAWYAEEDFINSKNPKTGEKFGRLGVSWGCPALAPEIAAKIIPILKNGGVLLHYYGPLMEEAMSGKEVSAPKTAENQETAVANGTDKNDNEEGAQK